MSKPTPSIVRRNLVYITPPLDEQWRISLMKELIRVRNAGYVDMPGLNSSEIEDMLISACAVTRHTLIFISLYSYSALCHYLA